MRDPKTYLQHILHAIERIEEYALDTDEEQFLSDFKTQDAIIRQLEIIGEASRQLEEPFKQQYPELPWRHMIALRNKLMHEYFGIGVKVIWETIKVDVPPVKKAVARLVSQL